jgi:hypothetical protein
MILESRLGGWRIDNGDDYGLHYVMYGEAKQAARTLRTLPGVPGFCNFRQLVAWARGDGFDAVVDEREAVTSC